MRIIFWAHFECEKFSHWFRCEFRATSIVWIVVGTERQLWIFEAQNWYKNDHKSIIMRKTIECLENRVHTTTQSICGITFFSTQSWKIISYRWQRATPNNWKQSIRTNRMFAQVLIFERLRVTSWWFYTFYLLYRRQQFSLRSNFPSVWSQHEAFFYYSQEEKKLNSKTGNIVGTLFCKTMPILWKMWRVNCAYSKFKCFLCVKLVCCISWQLQ